MTPTLIFIAVFAAVALLVAAIGLALRDYYLTNDVAPSLAVGENYELTPDDLVAAQPRGTALDRWFDRLVAQAGLDTTPQIALLLALATGLLLGGAMWLWQERWTFAVAGLLLGIAVVLGLFLYFRARRRRILREQMPNAITLLSRSVQAGQTLDQAIALVGNQTQDPLAREFRQCALHMDMGLSIDAAMRSFTRRVPLDEAKIFASTLVIQRRMGGNLPETLRTLVHVIRDRLSYVRQFRAATTAPRLSALGIALVGLFLAWYLWTWRPDYLQQLTDRPQGQIALAIAAALFVAGLLWTFTLLRPKY